MTWVSTATIQERLLTEDPRAPGAVRDVDHSQTQHRPAHGRAQRVPESPQRRDHLTATASRCFANPASSARMQAAALPSAFSGPQRSGVPSRTAEQKLAISWL
jgi:hypothetical protein